MSGTTSWTLVFALLTLSACADPSGSGPALGEETAALTGTPFVIDDFTTGLDDFHPPGSVLESRLQPGSMLGGVREVYFMVDAGELQQRTSYTIGGEDGLIVSSGLKSDWGVYLNYGYDMNYNFAPFNLPMSDHDRVCLDFGSNDQPISGGVQFSKGSDHATANWYAGASNGHLPVSIHYDEFATTNGVPLPWDGVILVTVLLQSGSANAGNDFQLDSVTLGACPPP